MWWLLLLVGVVVAGDDDGGGCLQDPPHCDGIGVIHLLENQTLIYSIAGSWGLYLPGDVPRPQVARQNVTVQGRVAVTRVSPCRLKLDVWNVSFSDWQESGEGMEGAVETWVVVSGGAVGGVCSPTPTVTRYSAHLHALARSVTSAVMNVVPDLGGQPVTAYERDHHGQCATQYTLTRAWPRGRVVLRTKEVATCNPRHAGGKPLSALINNSTLSCHQLYEASVRGETLQQVRCEQTVTLPSVATMDSSLTLSLLETHPFRPGPLHTGPLHELHLEMEMKATLGRPQQITKAYSLLHQMCEALHQRVTSEAALLYPDLVDVLQHLPQETLVAQYQEINSGRLCPNHHRLRGVFSGALRDSSAPSAAAAKCSLITSGLARSSPSWALSLGNVKQPTTETLHTCGGLLVTDHWDASEVLGLASMARQASCQESDHCPVVEAARRIAHRLSGKLNSCSEQEHQHQVLIAIRGLANLRHYSPEVERGLRVCGGNAGAPEGVRVAAVAALGRGPCSYQVLNWLKWEVLNETLVPELRITAFKALWECREKEAEAIATLITQRDSDSQVKAYVSDFLSDSKAKQDTHLFSRHLVTNLTSLLGLRDTYLHTDVVFQDSFLPRSIALNLSSPLLKHFGGSVQLGSRLENLEELLQAVFGPKGVAGGSVEAWLVTLVDKIEQMFATASQDFIQDHGRSKRSYALSDVVKLLNRVRHNAVTELQGWLSAGLGDQERLFLPFVFDPLVLQWEELITAWFDDLLEATYSSLINSNAELSTGWVEVEERVLMWSVVGAPVEVWYQEGGLVSLTASSKINLLSLLTNPQASTLKVALAPSMAVYSRRGISVSSLTGRTAAVSTTQAAAAVGIAAVLTPQGSDSVDLRLDLPDSSFHGYTIEVTQSLETPEGDTRNPEAESALDIDEETVDITKAVEDDDNSACLANDNIIPDMGEIFGDGAGRVLLTKRHCNRALETALGIKSGQVKQWVVGRHRAAVRSLGYLQKQAGITGYKILLSWKNPGRKSFFLDMSVEAEGSHQEYKAGLVVGLSHAPHWIFKVQLHSKEFSASAEASLVNDPNLKRVEGHVTCQTIHYGLKAELLMMRDGGHMSVKPRLVISYPGMQEDALLEGYFARYFSDKVNSVFLDLYTEGSLKAHYLDAALKGTVEIRYTPEGINIVTLKNMNFSSPSLSFGIEATLTLKDKGVAGRLQVTWGAGAAEVVERAVILEGVAGTGEDQAYEMSLQIQFPSSAHLPTSILCITRAHDSQVMNNVTLRMGREAAHREFHVFHSTAWRVTREPAVTEDVLPQIVSRHHSLAAEVKNILWITSDAAMDWRVSHVLAVTDRSVENRITADINDEHHYVKANFYDLSEEAFKYRMELELSLASWYFSYVDTLEQQGDGEVVGVSTSVMPSGRVFNTTSRYLVKSEGGIFHVELYLDVLVVDGSLSWNITGQEILKWTPSGITLEAWVKTGLEDVFGLEASLEGVSLSRMELHAKTWTKDLYEGEMSFGSEDGKTNFLLNLLVIPFNQEIISRVALDHHQDTGGKLDGELSWDARGDPSSALTLSSALQLPHVGSPLQISGSLSFLHWTWETSLMVAFGNRVGDIHKVSFIFILPDKSRFATGTLMNLSFSHKNFSVVTDFYLHLPAGDNHTLSVSAKGTLSDALSEVSLKLNADSPVSHEMHFLAYVIKRETEDASNLEFKLHTASEAKYWQAFKTEVKGEWTENQMDGVAKIDVADVAVMVNVSGLYKVIGEEHQLSASAELRVPSLAAWCQLKAALEGNMTIGQNPSSLKVTHRTMVEKDHEEIFSSRGQLTVCAPDVNGNLTILHDGHFASEQLYNLEGRFTGQEIEMRVEGTVDGEPLRATVHYVLNKQVSVHISFRSEDHFNLSFTTQLDDFLMGAGHWAGPGYSLHTEGRLVVMGQHTKMNHHLSISDSRVSSVFKLARIEGRVFVLKTTRCKLGLNHWRTDVSLTWGRQVFTYRDEVNIPSLRDFSLRVEVDAPAFILNSVLLVETGEEAEGGQTVFLHLQQHNFTVHSARMMFNNYDTDGESVWQAGATELVLNGQMYQDVMFRHVVIPLASGLEVKSNMTLGRTPLVVVGVQVTPNTSALGLALCSTGEECVRVQAQAMAQSTPSTRTLSVSTHALNSLFWKDLQEVLTQNSVTFVAEETSERTLVSVGVQRRQCEHVACLASTSLGLLHTTLLLTHNTLDMTLNTTHRTIALASVLRENQADGIPDTSLPGGVLDHHYLLENRLWLDRERKPDDAIQWTTSLASYVSSRASEYALSSSLHHSSLVKALNVEGSVVVDAEPAVTLVVVLDVFSTRDDLLKVEVEVEQEGGRYILHGTLAKARSISNPLIEATVVVVPSPDSSELSVTVVVPAVTPLHRPPTASPQLHFKLLCGLDAVNTLTTISCKLMTPSVNEKLTVGYQRWTTQGCVGDLASLNLLNHTYQLHHTACHDPANLQIAASRTAAEGQGKEELSLNVGMVDAHQAEMDLLGALGLTLRLHPPFLVHVSAHHRDSLQTWWRDILTKVNEEMNNLTAIAKYVLQDIAADLTKARRLSIVSSGSPAITLAHHCHTEGRQLLQEIQDDQLLLDIIHSIQVSFNMTSLIVEAGFAYVSHHYGGALHEAVAGVREWLEAAYRNMSTRFTLLAEDVQYYLNTSLAFITNSPRLLLDQVLSVSFTRLAAEWAREQIHMIQESVVYTFTRDSAIVIANFIHKVLSFIYSEEEETQNNEDSEVWHIWVPLGKCGHSLLEVWRYMTGPSNWVPHREYLGSTLVKWWHLLSHPLKLFHHLFPPFPGEGAIIGDNNFVSIDGNTFSLAPSCAHVLLTDAKHKLFTLTSHQQEATSGTTYTLLLGDTTVNVLSDLLVTVNNATVTLPYISEAVSVVRRLRVLEVAARDTSGQELVWLTCWFGQRACVVGVSGWLHADTKGLLGNFNLNPADDFMRPSGKVALSRDVFSKSWRLGSKCLPERDSPMPSPRPEMQRLCHKFLLHYTAPVYACHDAVNILPFYNTCLRYLTSQRDGRRETRAEQESATLYDSELTTSHFLPPSSPSPSQKDEEIEETIKSTSNSTIYINIRDLLFHFPEENNMFSGVSLKEISMVCDVAAAYGTVCSRHGIDIALPPLCGRGNQLTYGEPVSPQPQLDVVMLVNEESCDAFIYQNLLRPLPQVLTRVAQGKNISNVHLGVLGFGAGGGEVVYRTRGTSLLTAASEVRIVQPPQRQRSQASLLSGMRALKKYPFRPGSMRVGLVLQCDGHDIPKFTDTLPKEMQRRRLALFTLTPDHLMFSPRRLKAVRNTIGIDRWRVYNLHQDRQRTTDSLDIRAPSSNIAQLAMKSGGGVFSLAALRSDSRARYHMKLFRRVLSRAIVKVVVNAYRQRPLA